MKKTLTVPYTTCYSICEERGGASERDKIVPQDFYVRTTCHCMAREDEVGGWGQHEACNRIQGQNMLRTTSTVIRNSQ